MSPGTYARGLLLLGLEDKITLIESARGPVPRAFAHALVHEFEMTCLPVRHPSLDGELLAFLE
jgi:hypothetical protein